MPIITSIPQGSITGVRSEVQRSFQLLQKDDALTLLFSGDPICYMIYSAVRWSINRANELMGAILAYCRIRRNKHAQTIQCSDFPAGWAMGGGWYACSEPVTCQSAQISAYHLLKE